MKLKIIIFLVIILTSCETTNKKVITNKDFKNYSNDGFALIFNNDIFKKRLVSKKIDQRSLVIFNNKLKKDTDIKITNLLNEKYLIAKVGKEKANHGDCVHIGRAQIGIVTSACLSPTLGKNIALCRIDVGHSEIGTEVEIGKIYLLIKK